MQYHGIKTKKEVQQLARRYWEVMSENKFFPKTVAMFTDIGLKWLPPPQGYNVDLPDNYFKLYDWDFSEFNREVSYFIDQFNLNSICIHHLAPDRANLFFHLPGKNLRSFKPGQFGMDITPNTVLGWQTFREMTFVAWGKRPGDKFFDRSIEITQDQFDRLILDYFRAVAENLDQNGWLEKSYILIDERWDFGRLIHFLNLLKSDPLISKIRVVQCIQETRYFTESRKKSGESIFADLITYMPEQDERFNRWERHFFSDYGIPERRDKLWNYVVWSARLNIDAPGINNRMIALEMFKRGGGGYYDWETILWDHGRNASLNPWENPYSSLGNGALSYFYPPDRSGLSPVPDYTVTPSLRVMTFRKSVDDYEYALLLERLVQDGKERGIDVSAGEEIFVDIERFFYNSVHWSQNDAWYLDLRERMAQAIMDLHNRLNRRGNHAIDSIRQCEQD